MKTKWNLPWRIASCSLIELYRTIAWTRSTHANSYTGSQALQTAWPVYFLLIGQFLIYYHVLWPLILWPPSKILSHLNIIFLMLLRRSCVLSPRLYMFFQPSGHRYPRMFEIELNLIKFIKYKAIIYTFVQWIQYSLIKHFRLQDHTMTDIKTYYVSITNKDTAYIDI